jgi:hypothetical protein
MAAARGELEHQIAAEQRFNCHRDVRRSLSSCTAKLAGNMPARASNMLALPATRELLKHRKRAIDSREHFLFPENFEEMI